jgi:hypothetical protein
MILGKGSIQQLPVIERRIKHILKDIDKITNGI